MPAIAGMENNMPLFVKIIIIVIVSYLIGNINIAVIISRIKDKDIRKMGSGNPGTMNMLRNFGFKLGAFTMFLDMLKCALPAVGAYFFTLGDFSGYVENGAGILGYYYPDVSKLGMYIAGLSVILGHLYPVFYRFKGGKGVASSIGLFAAVNPLIMLIVFIIAVLYLLFFKLGAVASFICVGALAITETVLCIVYGDSWIIAVMALVIFALILYAHRANIKRLIKGNESRTYLFKPKTENTNS